MNTHKCSGCRNHLKGGSFLECCRCVDKYHYTCINLTKETYQNLTKEQKESWVCPSCRAKEPKIGDNSNTPVRSAPVVAPGIKQSEVVAIPQYDNITLRSKPRATVTCSCPSADIIRDIIREELDRKFGTEIKEIKEKLSRLDETIAHFNNEFDKVKRECESQTNLISQLQGENEKLKVISTNLAQRMNQAEQLSRTCNIEIQCVPEYKNENLYSTVLQLAKTIKHPISESDLHYCTRIAKLNPTSARPRSILVRLGSRRLRDSLLAGVIEFNRNNPTDKLNTSHLGYGGNKKSPVFVCENLTPDAKQLHAEARHKAKELNYRFCWVRDGKVFLRKTESSGYILVKNRAVLNSLS